MRTHAPRSDCQMADCNAAWHNCSARLPLVGSCTSINCNAVWDFRKMGALITELVSAHGLVCTTLLGPCGWRCGKIASVMQCANRNAPRWCLRNVSSNLCYSNGCTTFSSSLAKMGFLGQFKFSCSDADERRWGSVSTASRFTQERVQSLINRKDSTSPGGRQQH